MADGGTAGRRGRLLSPGRVLAAAVACGLLARLLRDESPSDGPGPRETGRSPVPARPAPPADPPPMARRPDERVLTLRLTPGAVVRVLGAAAAAVVLLGVLAEVSRVGLGHGRLLGLVPLTDLDGEANLPATFGAVLLGLCAVCVWALGAWRAQTRQPHATVLRLLALLLLFMALDEAAQIHEILSEPVRTSLDLSGVLYYAWVLVYGLAFMVLVVILLPRSRLLPAWVRNRLALAAAIYVGGALGLELAGGAVADAGGRGEWLYASLTTIEEALELTGALLLLHTLLLCVTEALDRVRLQLGEPAPLVAAPGVDRGVGVRVG